MDIRCITNLEECKSIWQKLSPNEFLYDDWDFRYNYYKYFNYPLYFYTVYEGDEPVAVLPLMLDDSINKITFFISVEYMEQNRIFVKKDYEYCKYNLYQQAKNLHDNLYLEYLNKSESEISNVIYAEPNYFLQLKKYQSYKELLIDYIGSRSSKVLKQFEEFKSENFTLEQGDHNNVTLLIEYSKNRFKEKSSFITRPYWEDYFYYLSERNDCNFIIIKNQGKVIAIGMMIRYNSICYGINSGYDTSISNLGKYLTCMKINWAIKMNCTIYDAGSGSFGWKEDFHLDKNPLYIMQ